jgi:hypothetical protein
MECVSWLQKPWGYTACLLANSAFELWTGHVLAGGYSSRHWHDKKWNRIASRTAVLRCTIYHGDGDTEQAIWIAPGEFYDFAPGVEHRFEVMQSGLIWETYWGQCEPGDIVRRDANGWMPPRDVVRAVS